MTEQRYYVVMKTPLGKKHGDLYVSTEENQISGRLSIFGRSEPFRGTVDKFGRCEITGVFNTLMRTVPFVAHGTITESSVNLQMKEDRNTFELTGVSGPAGFSGTESGEAKR